MQRRSLLPAVLLAGSVVSLAAFTLTAGPLDPPSGPVGSSYKTLGEVEPRIAISALNTPGDDDSLYRITQPGSYYLTGNVTGVAGKYGIEIATSGVSIDLNGFELIGVADALSGIYLSQPDTRNTSVRNGAVSHWPQTGINLAIVNYAGRLENLRAESNGADGIAGGNAYTISGCSAMENGSNGIVAFTAASVTNCTSRGNGFHGFSFSLAANLNNCTSYGNSQTGFSTSDGALISQCSAYSNGNDGFVLASGEIRSCTSANNAGDGIQVNSQNIVIGNSCRNNGTGDGAGIHVTGADNRIEGNNCSGADRGIDVDLAGNYIVGNSCSGNTTNWDVVAGNACVVYVAQTSGAITGDSGGGSPVVKDPQANVTY